MAEESDRAYQIGCVSAESGAILFLPDEAPDAL